MFIHILVVVTSGGAQRTHLLLITVLGSFFIFWATDMSVLRKSCGIRNWAWVFHMQSMCFCPLNHLPELQCFCSMYMSAHYIGDRTHDPRNTRLVSPTFLAMVFAAGCTVELWCWHKASCVAPDIALCCVTGLQRAVGIVLGPCTWHQGLSL